jgi:hypothetical protein
VLQLNWKAAATVATGATALAGWLATPPPPPREAARTTTAQRPAPDALSLEHEATRLAARIKATAAYEQPSRNPFRFPVVAPTPRAAVAEPAAVTSTPVVPAAPVFPFRLAGTASDTATGATIWTAVLSSETFGLVLAGVGDVVAGNYRIDGIDDGGVDVVDVRDGRTIRLSLGR